MPNKTKKAFITGITGQDGYYLTKHLKSMDYEVHGLLRRNALSTTGHIDPNDVILHVGDLTDPNSINKILRNNIFDEIYHLGAQTFVKESFDNPRHTVEVNTLGTLNVLSAMKSFQPHAKLYNAGTSEMFGNAKKTTSLDSGDAYNEDSRFEPQSPYGVGKVAAYQLCDIFRGSYGLHISTGFLFNHESPKRGDEFVTQKIIKGLVKCAVTYGTDQFEPVVLGNLTARRDWGFSGDYVRAMHLMLQQKDPDDYVIATGVNYSVEDFCRMALDRVNLVTQQHMQFDKVFAVSEDHKRPLEVDDLLGDPWKANNYLGWTAEVDIYELIEMMVDSALSPYK